jgi:hypothetical protein
MIDWRRMRRDAAELLARLQVHVDVSQSLASYPLAIRRMVAIDLQPLIATLAGMFLARGLCYLIGIEPITIEDPLFVAMSQTRIPFLGGFLAPGVLVPGTSCVVQRVTAFKSPCDARLI